MAGWARFRMGQTMPGWANGSSLDKVRLTPPRDTRTHSIHVDTIYSRRRIDCASKLIN